MGRAVIFIHNEDARDKARHWVNKAKFGTRIEFRGPKRTIEQNNRMWAMLTEVSQQLDWHGQKYSPENWKDYFMHAYKGEKWMPGEDGGMVPIGRATSQLSAEEHTEFTTLIEAFAARQGVTLYEDIA